LQRWWRRQRRRDRYAGGAGNACSGRQEARLGGLIAMTTQRARKVGLVAQASIEDAWQRRATEAAIAAARGVVKHDGPISPLTPIGRLGDIEWGWAVAAILFGWI